MKSMRFAIAATSVLYCGVTFGQSLPVSLPTLPTAALGPVVSTLPTLPLALPSPTSLPGLGGLGVPSLPSLPGLGGGGGLPGLPTGLPTLPSLPLALPSAASLPSLGGLGLPVPGVDGVLGSIPTGLPGLSGGAIPNPFDVPAMIADASPIGIPTFPVLPTLQSFPGLADVTGGAAPDLGGALNLNDLASMVPTLPNPEIPGVLPANFDPKTTLDVVTRFAPQL